MERIFNKYRYSRRVFLERGMRFAAGGLTTALAQEARRPAGRRPQRVAVIGAGHYEAGKSVPSHICWFDLTSLEFNATSMRAIRGCSARQRRAAAPF